MGRALEVHLLEELGEVGDARDGDDDVLVDLEARGALGDEGEAMAVLPEALALGLVPGHGDVDKLLPVDHVHDVVDALVEQIGIVAVHLDDDDRDGLSLVLGALGLVVDGLDVLGVELLEGRDASVVALLADLVAQGHEFADHDGRGTHAATEKLQGHDAAEFGLGMDGEADLGDDAVGALFLDAGQAPEGLVGDVLAKAGQADLVALEVDDAAHAPGDVLDGEDGGLVGKDLVARMVLALDGDDLARGRHHAPPKQVVDGGAVLEGHGTAGIL